MMAFPANPTPLLDLPLELREEIYKEVLVSPAKSFGLLQTCREIHDGAQKFLYQRPLVFRSQLDLCKWSRSTLAENCSRVTEISLFLQDVDLGAILQPQVTSAMVASPPRLLTSTLYEIELSKLCEALKRLPKVEIFSLRVLDRQSFLYRAFITNVLNSLSSTFPVLKDLRVEGSIIHQSLDLLSKFKTLRHLTLGGVSTCSARVAERILNEMEQLESLSFISNQPTNILLCNPSDDSINTEKPRKKTRKETQDWKDPPSPPMNVLTSLLPSNHTARTLALPDDNKTLEEKTISPQKRHEKSLIALETILDKPAITHSIANEFDVPSKTLKRYDPTEHVVTLRIRIKSTDDVPDIINDLCRQQNEGGLAKLRRLILMRTGGDDTPQDALGASTETEVKMPTDAGDLLSFVALPVDGPLHTLSP